MKYIYYPGCSLEGTALEYNIATRVFLKAMHAELVELEDWTCCGATAADSSSYLLSLVLPARNLALAEKTDFPRDILVPCSACYLNLKKVQEKIRSEPEVLDRINEVLQEDHLRLEGKKRVRHLLDVLSHDLGADAIRPNVQKPLKGLQLALYYGCQCLRPYRVFDDPEDPRCMQPLVEAAGAEVHPWKMGGQCCGAAHMNTKKEVALELVGALLQGAKGADAIVTVCPMCQMNLEAYQAAISRERGEDLRITVLYLPQVLGLALGLSTEELRLDLNLAVTGPFQDRLRALNLG